MRKTYLYFIWLTLIGFLGVPVTAHATKSFTVNSTSATKILLPEMNSQPVMAGPGNIVKDLKFQLSVTNTGDETLNPGDEGYSVTLYYQDIPDIELCITSLPEALEPGETKEMELVWGGEDGFCIDSLSDYFLNGSVCIYNVPTYRYWNVRENIDNKVIRMSDFRVVKPYIASLRLVAENGSYSAASIVGNVGFSVVPNTEGASISKNFRIFSSGQLDAEIASIDFPEGFSSSWELPVSIPGNTTTLSNSDQYADITFTFAPENPGIYNGDIVINVTNGPALKIPVSGGKSGGKLYNMDFEDATTLGRKIVGGWVLGDNVALEVKNSSLLVEGDTIMLSHNLNSSSSLTTVSTPLLHFKKDEKLLFDARSKSSYGNGCPIVKVYYSTDRVDWKFAGVKICCNTSGTNEDATDLFDTTSPYRFKQYQVTIPEEGDFYIGFEMGFCSIDNILGGEEVDVPFDLYRSGSEGAESGMVNKPLIFSLTMQNNSAKKGVSQEDYNVYLYIDGKKVAEAEKQEWAPGATHNFTTSYIFHEPGTHKAYMVLEIADRRYKGEEYTIEIEPEVLVSEVTVGSTDYCYSTNWQGVPQLTTTNPYAPFRTYDKNSATDVILPEDYLAKYGITPGTVISGVKVKGFSSSAKKLNGPIRFYMTKTNASTVVADAIDMDLGGAEPLFEDDHWDLLGGSQTAWYDIVDFKFNRNFVYEGGNLLIHCIDEMDSYNTTYYEYTTELTQNTRHKSSDNYSSYLTMSYTTRNIVPVYHFSLVVEPPTVSGVVTNGEAPVANAVVTLLSEENVLYSGITDENGMYDITVFQSEKAYNMTVSAPGYVLYKRAEAVTFEDGSVEQDVELHTYLTVNGNVVNGRGELIEGATVSFISGDYTTSTLTDAEGNYTLTAYEYGDAATVNVDAADYVYQTKELDLTETADAVVDFEVVPFGNEREYTLNIKVAAVVPVEFENLPFTLKSVRFNETYPAKETVLNADGECTITVYGGAQMLTVKALGVEQKVIEFNVNRDYDLDVLLGEDVRNPENVKTVLIHDAITGQNDLLVTWNPDAAAGKAVRRVIARSAANPYESFIVTMDGNKVGETSDYEYTINNVAQGSHLITVTAKYATTQSEATALSTEVSNENCIPVIFNLNNNAGIEPKDLVVNLHGEQDYSVSAENNRAMVGFLPKGKYNVEVSAYGFESYSGEYDFDAPSFVDVDLTEIVVKPCNLTVDFVENADASGFEVTARWNQEFGMADSFESYDDFATGTFGDWKTLDLNTEPSYPMMLGSKLITFPGCSTPSDLVSVAPMVFNPEATTPSMAGEASVAAYTGVKSVIFQGPQGAEADKWLISPEVEVRDGFTFSCMAKAYTEYPETLELCISTTGDAAEDFTVLETVTPESAKWTPYSVSLAEYVGKKVRVAVHCTSVDGFMALVDDLAVCDPEGDKVSDMGNLIGYEVTMGGNSASTKDTAHTFSNVPEGSYVLGVKSLYASGASEQVTCPVNMVSGIDGIMGDSVVGDVTTPAGVVVLRNATRSDVNKLDKGIYIFNGKKVVVK